MERTIIIGGVAGGATAAARLRRLKEDMEIIVIEKGGYVSFANCGLPYYIGNVIKERESLELMTPEDFLNRFNIDIRINHEALSIDREKKNITVRDAKNGKELSLEYNYLVLSPGAAPIVPPFKGIDDVPVFTLRTIPDSVKIKEYIEEKNSKHATIIGGGFIGIEMAENLREKGLKVKIVEMLDQVMAPLDKEMAQMVHQELILNGVCLHLDDPVDYFLRENECNFVKPKNGERIETDIIILAIGVIPESSLARDAGLELGERGHVSVDESMRTSDPSIYAVGDAVQVKNYITQNPTAIPLAGPANKQGRVAAENIAGLSTVYRGVLGTSVVKVFDLTVSTVGLPEKQIKNSGIDYEKIYVHPNNHAGYYPGAVPITIKLVFQKNDGKILGAQAVGGPGAEKRIDVISTAINFGGTVYDLEELELAYAPPFGSAKDPVNMAGFVASNVLKGDMPVWQWDEVDRVKAEKNSFLLDVRTLVEFKTGTIEGAVNISDLELRGRLDEVPPDRDIYVFCQVGFRGYLASRLLLQNGYSSVYNLTGGYKLVETASMTTREIAEACAISEDIVSEMVKDKTSDTGEFIEIDASGIACPGPLNAMIKGLEDLPPDRKLRILATDPGFKASVEAYAKLEDSVELLYLRKEEGKLAATLQKTALKEPALPPVEEKKTRKELRKEGLPPISEINLDELYERITSDDPPSVIVDVRTMEEFNGREGHINRARLLPLDKLMDNMDSLKEYRDEEIVVVCHSGARSLMAARLLAREGFSDIRNLAGGMMMWNRKGYSTTKHEYM